MAIFPQLYCLQLENHLSLILVPEFLYSSDPPIELLDQQLHQA